MRAIIDIDYEDVRLAFENAKVEPIGGWGWLESARLRQYPEQTMTIFYNDKWVATLSSNVKHTKKGMKEIIAIAQM
jgi:hypothetical protein